MLKLKNRGILNVFKISPQLRPFSSISQNFVKIVDVSPRDGLQNESTIVPTSVKLELIDRLTKANIPSIEITSFVSPKWVPQMADAKDILRFVSSKYEGNGTSYPILIPNTKGLERALETGIAIKEIAIFGAASEGFSKKNTNTSVNEGIRILKEVADLAHSNGIKVRGYLSTVIGCPYDGPTDPKKVADLSQRYLEEIGCYELSLGDTIGVGTVKTTEKMLMEVFKKVAPSKIAIHAHDTYGQGVANVLKAVEMGVRVVDASVGGLGGCPYAQGATGNVSTEDIVYSLHNSGYQTGIDLDFLSKTGEWISTTIGRSNGSRAGKAIASKL
ncbi:uncharacterized protein SAPINGB_P005643 [Magnusiomyces paraingens]|uniref:hydroxymethylglutaryl-CoA lyase n=1 Tax=Magnusiomyces paraingens TaxID=2606893 RepID=A0A5E8C0X5_9ASCO|nr:uncharacterized protein SAPINGB_P005643 [Saprochaete ingens]VVT57287.1 unnamed protein product [Saprochaete ingens]